MTKGCTAQAKASFDPLLNIKKGNPFERDRLKCTTSIQTFDPDFFEFAFACDQKIVPILGQIVRIHLNRNQLNNPAPGIVTMTGAQGSVVNFKLNSHEYKEILRLFPFQSYTKLEAFLCRRSRQIYVYDILVRDGDVLGRDILSREVHLPVTNTASSISCFRSLRSLESIYKTLETLQQDEKQHGFLIRSGSNDEPGLRMTISI
jgi:hypothetical protein